MQLTPIVDGYVSRRVPGTPTAVAAGPRCAVTRGGDVVCTFVVQSALGINDFQPMISRSGDGGRTWTEARQIWPELVSRYSIFGSVSRAPGGELMYVGSRYVIDEPGESFWSEATQGLKQNEVIWARSLDDGETWCEPQVVPMPIAGSSELAGAMCVTRSGRWLCCYAPYPTFDPAVQVDRGQIVAMRSDDGGRTWASNAMIRFPGDDAGGAEAWVIELADGRLLGTTWHLQGSSDQPNAYAISHDAGDSWTPTRSTGIMGQSTALCALPDGRALFVYSQRKRGDIGIHVAAVQPTDDDFGLQSDELVWRAEVPTQDGSAGEMSDWPDFAFGEPSATLLPDGTVLVALWCVQPDGQGIRFVKLAMAD